MPKAKRKRIKLTIKRFNRLNDRYVKYIFANFILFEDTEDYHTVHRILDVKTQAWHSTSRRLIDA